MTELKFSISVYVFGVKKRCRKAEKHTLKLGYIDYNDGIFDKDAVSQKARDIVATNMKTLLSPISVQMIRMEIVKENGFISHQFAMFDERHVNFKLDTLLNEELK